MMRHIQAKRGFTLVELVIVMMVLGIMMVMVTSFSMMVNGWSKVGTNRYNLMQSERLAGQFLRKYVSAYDCADYYFMADGAKLYAVNRQNNSRAQFSFNGEDALEFVLPTTGEGYCPLDFIVDVHFIVRTTDNGQQLVRMQLRYKLPTTSVSMKQDSGEYTVLVSTRATGVSA